MRHLRSCSSLINLAICKLRFAETSRLKVDLTSYELGLMPSVPGEYRGRNDCDIFLVRRRLPTSGDGTMKIGNEQLVTVVSKR